MEGFFTGLSMVFHRLLGYSLEISTLIVLIFLFKRLASRRLPPWWHYCLWLILLVRMLAPLEFENRLNVFNFFPSILPNDPIESVAPQPSEPIVAVSVGSGVQEASPPLWRSFFEKHIPLAWFLGMCAFATYIAIKNLSFSWAVRRKPPLTDSGVLGLLAETKKRMGIRRKVPLIVTDRVNCPSLFGYLRPQLLLPEGIFKDLDGRELTYAFMHELGHLKRHDIGVSWVMAFLQAVYWFNPLVWLAFHQIRLDQEMACDASVLASMKGGDAREYARAIVGFLEKFCRNRQLPSLAGILESKVQMVSRITGILGYRKASWKNLLGACSLLAIAMVILFMMTGSVYREQAISDNVSAHNGTFDNGGDSESREMRSAESPADDAFQPLSRETLNSFQTALPETGVEFSGMSSRPVTATAAETDDMTSYSGEAQRGAGGHLSVREDVLPSDMTDDVIPRELGGNEGETFSPGVENDAVSPSVTDIQTVFNDSAVVGERGPSVPIVHQEIGGNNMDTPADVSDSVVFGENNTVPISISTPITIARAEDPSEIAFGQGRAVGIDGGDSGPVATTTVEPAHVWEAKTAETMSSNEVRGGSPGGGNVYMPSDVDVLPQVIRTYTPRYPYIAKRDNISGSITVQFVVSKDGHAVGSRVVASDPEGVFDASALEAIDVYRFEPGRKDGKAVDVMVSLPIKFDLS